MGTYAATNQNIIENIYLGGGKFDKGNLDKLAAKVGYTSGVGDLVTAATDFNYTNDNIGFKNSADFGDTVVKFGTYTYGGTERELSWYPTFVSKSDGGDVILTLWLASTDDKNGTVSDQEVSMFTGGGYNNHSFADPSSDNYSTSMLRAKTLNNGGKYYSGYNNTNAKQETPLTETDYTPTSNGTNKYEIFTTGSVKDFIVTPSKVSWQNSANKQKNDPEWTASSGHYTPQGWLEDRLWIPSLYEVFDEDLADQSDKYNDFHETGGLWQTGKGNANRQKRSNTRAYWLRSGHPGVFFCIYSLYYTGDWQEANVYNPFAVRPALHLNLTKAAANSFNTIENIYDQANNKFNTANLNALAQAAEFTDLNSMIKYAKNGDKKTSQDFGDTLVNFGSYTYGGIQRELTWIPTYVSQDDKGNAILTLWLAGTDSANGTLSDQEISSFSDGTYSQTVSQTFNGTTVYSNSYDGSYIRNYILNGSSNYAGNYDTNSPISNKPAADTLTKFTQFTTGALKDYIVTPENVSWQNNASYMKNDAQWNASGYATDALGNNEESYPIKGTAANYPASWLNDKLWLPSIYETYDSTITSAGTRRWGFAANGGLWNIGNSSNRQKRSNTIWTWLRSAGPSSYYRVTYFYENGGCNYNIVSDIGAVRPALHLNLSKALCNSSGHSWDEGTVTKEATCTETGVLTKTCTVCGETKTETIEKLAHAWDTTAWLNDDTNHWHKCANCTEITDKAEHTPSEWITDTPATCTKEGTQHKECTVCKKLLETGTIPKTEHPWNEGEQTTAPTCTKEGVKTYTCTKCPATKTEPIEKIPHTPETIPAVAPTCTEKGKTAGAHCSVCNVIITEQKEVPALGHNYKWVIIKQPTKDETGLKKNTCTVCGDVSEEEVIAKLVEDEGGNGSVGDLPELPDPDSNYKLEITIKATDKVYALDGQSKGYNVRLWIVNNKTDDKKEFNKEMEVTLSLIVPHGMEDFTLYKLVEGGFEEIKPENYTVEAGILSIRTTLPEEFIFNTAAAPAKAGVPWWVWLIVSLAVVAVVIIIVIVVVKKKHAPAPETETVYVNGESYDDTELKRKVEEQNEKIDELLNREIPVDALSQTLTDDEMRSFFTDEELQSMVQQGKITQEDYDRVIRGRKR